jgi:hypothetical protein
VWFRFGTRKNDKPAKLTMPDTRPLLARIINPEEAMTTSWTLQGRSGPQTTCDYRRDGRNHCPRLWRRATHEKQPERKTE